MSAARAMPRPAGGAAAGPDRVAARLRERFPGFEPGEAWRRTEARYPARASAYYLDLIQAPLDSDPVFRQAAPLDRELDPDGHDDPTGEERWQAAPGLLHRHPDRVLILIATECFVHCRHCMRKRNWGRQNDNPPLSETLRQWSSYIDRHPEVRELILSGGDPLTRSDAELERALEALASIPHVVNLRVHTRAPAVQPGRITPRLASMLADHKTTRLVTQFNHPAEITRAAYVAAGLLWDRDISVENQAVLLAGVNDRAEVLAELFRKLHAARIVPYYLHHPDPVRGAMHFYLDPARGLEIFRRARGLAPEAPFPDYVQDRPGPEGKAPVGRLLRGPGEVF